MFHYFPENYMWSYQVVRMMCQAQSGGGEVNEILEVASEIKVGDYESFHSAWMNMGNKTLTKANEALDQGRIETARTTYLNASNYIRTAEFFLQPDDERKIPTYLKGVEAFRKGAEMLDNPPQAIQIPYENSHLPGYYFPVKDKVNSPLVIMFGGLDSTAEELYFGPAQELNERGISFLAVDGPGQGGALRLNHIHSRYDYNVAGTAAYEWAVNNLDIDPERVGIMAVSMGGYMAARSAAFEPRFKACAIWGAVYDYNYTWSQRPDDHPLARIIMHVMGKDNMADTRKELDRFNLRGVAEKISMPTYILHGEDDRQNTVKNAYDLYNDLTCERQMKIVPKSSSGSAHCQVDNFTETYEMFDFLKEQLTK
ncbi:alpha/beta hydrolase family protein [Halalkalibacter alkaliphilus]|uniref:Alpha/beta hydrolase n=1 Tax=Halalkalibacter alkaliphilus TaxID=2917993 RepID=A0A9X2CUX0_9BACI|nr:prolyl oligopeptidase family serine peptidase [Halalkalibacter alkaliphilus]MCL7748487.1 alpha/beta hydrolase [Halalkalibacter alkaliphilus]